MNRELKELLEEDIDFEEQNLTGNIEMPRVVRKLSMNRILDLIKAHYYSEEEWERQLKGFVESIQDEQMREHFKKQITFNCNIEKSLFYRWGMEV